MRILLVHNRYRSGFPGGEDAVVTAEQALLESAGHEVILYERSNDEMREGRLSDQLIVAKDLVLGSMRTERELREVLRASQPEVAHFHNVFPLIGSNAYTACWQAGVPIVQTLHNYRYACAAATHFRSGAICEACSAQRPWAAIRYGCYRDSRLGSAAVAWSIRRSALLAIAQARVSRFLVLTRFAAERLIREGVDPARILIKANSVEVNGTTADQPIASGVTETNRPAHFLFVGRLAEEKGLRVLLSAWAHLKDIPLRIVGDGPLRSELEAQARRAQLSVEFCGMQSPAEVRAQMARARALIFPSLWFEGMPLTLLEAWQARLPVIASDLGAMRERLSHGETGLLYPAHDPQALASTVRGFMETPQAEVDRWIERAHHILQAEHSAEASLQQLLRAYQEAKADREARPDQTSQGDRATRATHAR